MAPTSQTDSVHSANPPRPAPSPPWTSREGGWLQDQSAQAAAPPFCSECKAPQGRDRSSFPAQPGCGRQLRTHWPEGGLDTPEWTKQYKPQRESKSVPGGESTQTVIPEGTWLPDKGKQLQTTTTSHFHLKLILWPAVQVISNMKLYKNIIPNHNRGKPFSFPHLPPSHCSKNLLHHGSDNHRNSKSFHIMFSRIRSVSGLMVSLQISKVKQQLAPDYTEETWNEIFKNLLVSKLLWWPKDWEICLCDKRHSLLTY